MCRLVRILCLTSAVPFVLAACLIAKEEPEQKPPFAQDSELEAVAALLDMAWSGDPAAAQAVKEQYESRRSRVTDRGRWHFAYGLSALKLKRHAAAVTAFQAAIRDAKTFSFSPWKGLIWTELTLKHHDAALQEIETLARKLAEPDFSGSDEEREQIASWIGQTLAAVEKLNASPKIRQHVEKTDAFLAENWNGDLLDAYKTGWDYTNIVYDELMDQVKEATDEAKAKEKHSLEQKQTRLQENAATAEEKKAALAKMADDVKKQAERRLLQIDKQLVRLERDYNYLQARSMSVLQSMSILQTQLSYVQAQQQRPNANIQVQNSFVAGLVQPVQRLNLLLAMHQQELDATTIRALLVAQQAMEGLQTREQLVQQVQATAAELEGQKESLSKWQERMSQAAGKLQQTKPKGDSVSVRAKRVKAKTLSTYLEFDLDWERIKLTERPAES
jgi:hypothetical protein